MPAKPLSHNQLLKALMLLRPGDSESESVSQGPRQTQPDKGRVGLDSETRKLSSGSRLARRTLGGCRSASVTPASS